LTTRYVTFDLLTSESNQFILVSTSPPYIAYMPMAGSLLVLYTLLVLYKSLTCAQN